MIRKVAFAVLLGVCQLTPSLANEIAPEDATGWNAQAVQSTEGWMAVTAHPLASQAAAQMLKQGGSAVDAMIAAQLMLTLVEPQSSGIGGGAFALWYQAESQKVSAWDGRETAPAELDETYFLQEDGRPQSWWEAMRGGKSVGVPGVMKLMQTLHQKGGKLPWKQLFQPAIKASEEGFVVGLRLHGLLAKDTNRYLRESEAAEYFYPEGNPLPVGFVRTNPELARTLRMLSHSPDEFYRGALSYKIREAVQESPVNPGLMSHRDLRNYQVVEREILCAEVKAYKVCGMPPPTSGGVAVLQALKLLEGREWPEINQGLSVDNTHALLQAMRVVFSDRNQYIADPDFVPDVAPAVQAMLSDDYIQARQAHLLAPATDGIEPGAFPELSLHQAPASTHHAIPSTSHISIVDAEGNAISMTSSIEMAFGSTVWVEGFLLNNQLTDFSFVPEKNGLPTANRPQGGKRPRSSMAPMMVFKGDQLHLLAGSPGGSRIIGYVTQSLVNVLFRGATAQQAVEQPHVLHLNGASAEIELGKHGVSSVVSEGLQAKGHAVKARELNSGLHLIQKGADGAWHSGVDPRREGMAMTEEALMVE